MAAQTLHRHGKDLEEGTQKFLTLLCPCPLDRGNAARGVWQRQDPALEEGRGLTYHRTDKKEGLDFFLTPLCASYLIKLLICPELDPGYCLSIDTVDI